VKTIPHRHHAAGKRKIHQRLDKPVTAPSPRPVFTASNIHYEAATKTQAISCGGIGAIQLLVRKLGLAEAIDERLHLLKFHLPYHESDHVLNFAYNALCNGTCLDDIELRRNDVVFLDALGADRIPDPTTAGDFCRRFTADDVETLQDVFDQTRVKVWKQQPSDFFDEAVLDVDGTLVPTGAGCKQGVNIAYDGTWGYHPLIITLANTGEVLSIVNRSGNRPSHEGAAEQLDLAILLCRDAGFRKVYLRGDTDFTQTKHLDAWDAENVTFLFGIDAMPNLKAIAEDLPASSWTELERLHQRVARLKALPWSRVPATTAVATGHGRRVRRTIRAVQAPGWVDFPGVAQILQVRRTRTINGRKRTEVVYVICSLDMAAAPKATVASWIQGHWSIENALHWVRDVVFDEDRHQLRTGSGPQVMATLRNTAISLLRLAGHTRIAKALRHHSRDPDRPIDLILTA
jgi:predicted transposase YbfD/YdcC